MDQELLLHFDLILILVLVGRQLCNLLLSIDTLDAALQCVLFVSARLLKSFDPMLPLDLLGVNVEHDLAQSHVRLVALLLRHTELLILRIRDRLLRLERRLHLLGLQLTRDEILLHTLLHVLILLFS